MGRDIMDNQNIEALPRAAGNYAIFISIPKPVRIIIGALGTANFPAGLYVYSGSASGPGGIRARLGRHLRGDSKTHWHIDYVRPHCQVRGWCYALTGKHEAGIAQHRLECLWSQTLANSPAASIPVARFGASDCSTACPAHLVAFPPDADPHSLHLMLAPVSQYTAVRRDPRYYNLR